MYVLDTVGLTLRMRLRSHWLLSEWIATVLRLVTLVTASHSRSAPSLQSTNTTTGGWYSLLSWKATKKNNLVRFYILYIYFFTFYNISPKTYFSNSELLCILTLWALNFILLSGCRLSSAQDWFTSLWKGKNPPTDGSHGPQNSNLTSWRKPTSTFIWGWLQIIFTGR